MPSEDTRVGPAGEVLAASIKRVRTARRLSYAELSRQLADIGRPIPELGLRRIELGERRVDYDDLLAISYVLQIAPVDLMVNKDATNESYPMTSELKFEAESVREWIRGADIRLAPFAAPEAIFAVPGTVIFDAVQWMPTERRKEVMRSWLEQDEDQS